MKRMLSIISFTIALTLVLASCGDAPAKDTLLDTSSAQLRESEDMGMEYIDSIIFIGESTTYHMKSREVLSGGSKTKQIWSPKSGTMTLDMSTPTQRIIYPETGEEMTIHDAAARAKPPMIILTFGLNGAVTSVRLGEDYFKKCYLALISSIKSASPDTVIILQSAFPVASNMDISNYTVSLSELNSFIDTINAWTLELSAAEGLFYLATSDVLKNARGELKYELQCGDGYHLTRGAYEIILTYIRTHGYKGAEK